MSKPLELTIYPPAECTCFPVEKPWTYYGIVEPGGAWEPNPDCAEHFTQPNPKRLTDAELAAEYHAAEVEAWRDSAICRRSPHTETLEHQSLTLHRLATRPHYFEADQ